MDITQIITAAIILTLAGLAQSVIGFGYALFATPLLLLGGMPLPAVIVLVGVCAMCQTAIGARSLRNDIPWKISGISIAVRLLGLVVGVLILMRLVALERETVQFVIGVILCLLVAAQCIWRPKPRDSIQPGWAGLAFFSSGVLSGLCGMGGPPVVLWAMSLNWNAHRTRGFLFVTLGGLIPAQLVLLAIAFGVDILWNALLALLLLPLIYAGSSLGLRIGRRIDKDRLRRMAYAVLLIMGASAIAPVFQR